MAFENVGPRRDLRRVLQLLRRCLVGEEVLGFIAQVCLHYLGDTTLCILKLLVVGSFGKRLLNLGLKYCCLKCGVFISQWVALIHV